MNKLKQYSIHFLVSLILLSTAGAAFGQVQTGSLQGTVGDDQNQAIPGVTVTLSGVGAPKVQVTDADGSYRFLNLPPGRYQLIAELEGFSTVEYPNVTIGVGRKTTVNVSLASAVEETITVTSEAPLIDERSFTRGTNIDAAELDQIPTARDPWAMLSLAPAVIIDRINVGGNESGQQSNFLGAGSQGIDNAFAVDGVILTDMAATGASMTYYDFGAIEEVQYTIGSSDVTIATSGVTVNQVTKRGGNQWAASGRFLRTDGGLQESPKTLPSGDLGNQIDVVDEFGAEIGGPLWKDHLWAWASYGESDIGNIVIGGQLDRTMLEDFNTKLNFQGTQANSGVLHFWTNDKLKSGRGAGPNRSPETTHNQITPADIWKFEDTHIFGSNFFVTGLWSNNDGVFNAAPQGGRDADVYWDADGVLHGSYWDFAQNGVVDQWRVDASYFFNTGGASHELKFGGGFREQENQSSTVWPGNKMVYSCEFFGCDTADNNAFVQFWRNKSLAASSTYESAWVQDTVTLDRWTINFGLRYDLQDVESLASTSLANPEVADLLPELTFSGNDAGGFEWESIVPRVGVTYAMGEERNTLLRGSFSQYAEQLGHSQASRTNPVGYAYAAFYFTDANQNLVLDSDETGSLSYYYYYNFDPDNPLALSTPNVTDPNFDPTMTDELTFGVEHGFTPNFSGGVTVTWRNITDIPEARQLVEDENGNVREVLTSDWVQDASVCDSGCTLPDGSSISSTPVWNLRDDVSFTGGRYLTNGDREHDYLGVTLNATKRLSNRWRLAGHLTWSDWDMNAGSDFRLHEDPTNTTVDNNELALQDGNEPFAERSAGSGDKGDIWAGSGWTFNVNTLYQVAPDKKWGFNLGASLTGREGFVSPPYATTSGGRRVQLGAFDRYRNDDIITLDARIEKDFEFNDFGFTLGIDGFNLSNEDYVLQRQRNVGAIDDEFNGNLVREILSPRVFRVGIKLHFR